MQDVNNRETGMVSVEGVYGNSLLSIQLSYKPKTDKKYSIN